MRTLLVLIALAMAATPAHAEGLDPLARKQVLEILRNALRTDPSILRDAMAAFQTDEAQREQQATNDAIAQLGSRLIDPQDQVAGNPAGTKTVIEFYDTRCPYCRSMLPTLASLLRADPNVRLVLKDMPILGPASITESRALLAAQRQGGYLKLQQALMTSPTAPSKDGLRAMADSLGLDGERLLRDMDDPAIQSRLQANLALARQLHIDGTPAFIIGNRMIAGAADLPDLQAALARKP